MAFHKAATYGESESILDSAVGLVTKTYQGTVGLAGEDGVIKAGTLIPAETTYEVVSDTASQNPQEKGWYVLNDGKYEKATDSSPQPDVTYYEQKTGTAPVGIVFEDYDMTDCEEGFPVSIVVQGRLKADKVSAEAKAQADAFAKQGLYLV